MMQDWLVSYGATIWAMGIIGILMVIQLVVHDVAGVKAGHVPGTAVTGDHGDFLFRATRAHANTNESIAIFILAALFGILHGAAPGWLNGAATVYVAARLAHMLCYYANVQMLRSVSFVVAFLALIVMLGAGVTAALR